jgi:hypothetical protein
MVYFAKYNGKLHWFKSHVNGMDFDYNVEKFSTILSLYLGRMFPKSVHQLLYTSSSPPCCERR